MLDEQDQGTRVGVGVALGVALLLAIGLALWLAIRGTMGAKAPAAPVAAAAKAGARAAAAAVPAGADAFIDAPLTGTIAGTFYFAVGKADLPADAPAVLGTIKAAAGAGKKLLISGFHDATGDPAFNAELAKNRAKAVRAALQAEGITPERTLLRKPESTTGDGSNQEARRVEVRLAD
jgi:outer membrane protein OmpA-like peptidoglycan-associated protein